MFDNNLALYFSGRNLLNQTTNISVTEYVSNTVFQNNFTSNGTSGVINEAWVNTNKNYLYYIFSSNSVCNLTFIAECVMKCSSSSYDSTGISWGFDTAGMSRSISITSSGELCFQFTAGAFDENNCVLTGKTGLNDGLYHHVVIVCPSNDKMLFFVDGKLVYSTSQSFSVLLTSFTTNNLRVGLNQTTNPVSVSRNLNVVYTRLYNIDRTNISDVLYNFYDISPVNVRYSYINQNNIWYKIEW